MTYKNLLLDVQSGIVILTINRPKALNALNTETLNEIRIFFEEGYKSISDLKGIIITGAGSKAFVAGADISEFNGLDAHQGADFSKNGQNIFFLIENFHKAVVALVNGYALGGGCELAMACHIRVACENALFGQPEVNLGIIAGYGGTQRLVQLIGKSKAMELLLTGNMIKASEAQQLGLVNYALPPDEALKKAIKIINKIASKAPIAVAKTIAAVNSHFDNNTNAFDVESTAFGHCAGTSDFVEGAKAFVEKRPANFKGE